MNGCSGGDDAAVGGGGDASAVQAVRPAAPAKGTAKVPRTAAGVGASPPSPEASEAAVPPAPALAGAGDAAVAPSGPAAPREVAAPGDCRAGADDADSKRAREEWVGEEEEVQVGEVQVLEGEVQVGEVQVGEVQVGEVQVLEGEVQVGEVQLREVQAGEMQAGEVQAGESEKQVGKVQGGEVQVGEVPAEEGEEQMGAEPVDLKQVEEEQPGEEEQEGEEEAEAEEEEEDDEKLGEEEKREEAGKPVALLPAADVTTQLQGKPGGAKKEEREGRDIQQRGAGAADLSKAAEAPVKDGQQLSAADKKKAKGLGKEITLLMQALNALSTPEKKLSALCTKYTQLLEEHRATQRQLKGLEEKHSAAARERNRLRTEYGKALLARSKLDSLCREQQRHNRTLKEENLQRAREKEEKLREVTAHFQATLTDIQAQMGQHNERNLRLKQENVELANMLKRIIELYELREEHVNKVFRNKDLQQQLSDAKLQQTTKLLEISGEEHLKEKELLIKQATETQGRCEHMKQREIQLKQQLALYTEKFEAFQGTLSKSNEVFSTFRQEIEQMTKKMKKLEKETSVWRTRWESSNKALLDMVEEKTRQDREKEALNAKVQKLEKLCRALQNERNELSKLQGPDAGGEVSDASEADVSDATTSAAVTAASAESDIPGTPQTTPNSNPEPNRDPESIPTVDGKAGEPEEMTPVELVAPELNSNNK